MSIHKTLQALESDGTILRFRFQHKDLLIWPFIRWRYLIEVIHPDENLSNLTIENRISFYGWIKYFYNVLRWNPFLFAKKTELVIGTSTISNILNDKGEYFHRLADYFIRDDLDTLILESQNSRAFKRPRSFKNVKYIDSVRIYAKIRAKFIKVNRKDIDTVDNFIAFLKEKSNTHIPDKFYKKMQNTLLQICKEVSHLDYGYNMLYDKIQPRIVLYEEASYLHNYLFIKIANERNIKTVEYQHGFIGSEHLAYNYGDFLYKSEELKKILPNYFLTYGKFWEKNIKLPVEKVTIGNPFLSEQICKYPRKVLQRKQILLVSSGLNVTMIRKLAAKLLLDFKDVPCDIYIRPHPSEKLEVIQGYSEVIDLGIKIDNEQNLYASLSTKDVLFGDYSTVLFEALAYGTRVFSHDDELTNHYMKDSYFFNKFRLSDNLKDLLETKTDKNIETKEIWEDGWREKYNSFINGILDEK